MLSWIVCYWSQSLKLHNFDEDCWNERQTSNVAGANERLEMFYPSKTAILQILSVQVKYVVQDKKVN